MKPTSLMECVELRKRESRHARLTWALRLVYVEGLISLNDWQRGEERLTKRFEEDQDVKHICRFNCG